MKASAFCSVRNESRKLADSWLRKAISDLGSAKRLADSDPPFLDTAAYHCQQAAEKALKGWLSLNEVPFPKTHLLDDLLDLCIPSLAAFEQFRDDCQTLTPLATEFRYPGDVFEPSAEEFATSLRMATRIVRFVSEQITTANPELSG